MSWDDLVDDAEDRVTTAVIKLDAADRLVSDLEARIVVLKGQKEELHKEVIHLQRCWDKCAELLRNAKARNHKLMMRAKRRSEGGN